MRPAADALKRAPGNYWHLDLMNKFSLCLAICLVVSGCAVRGARDLGYVPDPDPELRQRQQDEYKKGYVAAKADLRNGLLRFEDVNGGEEERWQIVWCYWKILKDNYGIDYRVLGHPGLPGPDARAAGYQKVVRPVIDARLGNGWEERIFQEAEAFHREHWDKVVDQYRSNPQACGSGG